MAQPKFQKYMSLVEGKGFFSGVEKGSAEYNERLDKLVASYKKKFGEQEESGAAEAGSAGGDDDTATADAFKTEGNTFLEQREYERAVESYTKAINASPAGPNSHIYYSNRAAAYQHLKNYEAALEDCAVSTSLKPDFSKAHARAAQANLSLGNNDDALESARRCLEIDPNNVGAKVIVSKLEGTLDRGSSSAGGGGGGMPDLGSLAGMMQGMDPNILNQARAAMGGGGGGMPDLASLMNNPQMMAAANKMMQNPEMMRMAQQMMSDPSAMENMMKAMGGGMPK
jgi:small glutamine-rich tetratricopeptide repeat-containing protein alpha